MRRGSGWSAVGMMCAALVVAVAVLVLGSCGSGSKSSTTSGGSSGSSGSAATKSTPTITWPQPAAITNPTPLGTAQLDATASVAGTFVYAPPAGTVLAAGTQKLSVTFTPADTTDYNTATASVNITVNAAPAATKSTPTITWLQPAPITNPTPLGAAQLDATASVPGTFVYTPAAGTVLAAGTQKLSVTFTPTDTTDYNTASASVNLTVDAAGTPAGQSSPVIYVSETAQNAGVGGNFSAVIEAFALDVSSGGLSAISGSPFATNYTTAGDMALAPGGGFAYVLVQNGNIGPISILTYALDASTGAPTLKQTLLTTAGEEATITMHPSGKFLYLTPYNGDNTGIGVFAVGSDGTLTFNGVTQAQSEFRGAVTPNGNFFYTAMDGAPVGDWGNNPCGPVSSDLYEFSVNASTGALTAVAGGPVVFQRQYCDVGNAPQYVMTQIDPAGDRLFVVDSNNSTVTVFAIDASTGALTLLPGTNSYGPAAGFYSSAIDPLGRYLYIGDSGYTFTGFSLTGSSTSGTLPVLPGMPVQMTPTQAYDGASNTLAVDSTGAYLFSNENEFTGAFSCCGPDSLVEFKINSGTGALTQLPATPFSLAGAASRILAAPPR